MLEIRAEGSTSQTEAWLKRITGSKSIRSVAESLAQRGVEALRAATPIDSGLTASQWNYEVVEDATGVSIYWKNTNVINGFNVAIGLQYGHGTGNGGWIEGYDYINPAMRPIFDQIADTVWKEVQR